MMAMTTRSSMSVKPEPFVEGGRPDRPCWHGFVMFFIILAENRGKARIDGKKWIDKRLVTATMEGTAVSSGLSRKMERFCLRSGRFHPMPKGAGRSVRQVATMFYCKVNEQAELRLIEPQHGAALFSLLDSNREHLRRWHPWVDLVRSVGDVEKAITAWERQHAANRGFNAGIWFQGRPCGMINHLNVDWPNRWTALSYWLDEGHQGRGIMTACCRAMVAHSFDTWQLNRVTIECATQNTRSRAIAERLGFKLEGIVRGIEWLHDRHVDHAIYGLLRADQANLRRP